MRQKAEWQFPGDEGKMGSYCGSSEVSQDVPLWYADCSELKAILASGSRKNFCPEKPELGTLPITGDYQR